MNEALPPIENFKGKADMYHEQHKRHLLLFRLMLPLCPLMIVTIPAALSLLGVPIIVGFVVASVTITFVLIGPFKFLENQQRASGIVCQFCDKPLLFGRKMFKTVVYTGNCPHCSRRIFQIEHAVG